MAGHSKWKNIRLRKGKQDALRGKLFTKLARDIIVAAKMGGGDPAVNARLCSQGQHRAGHRQGERRRRGHQL